MTPPTDRELFKMALEAIEWASDRIDPQGLVDCDCPLCQVSEALEQRLAPPANLSHLFPFPQGASDER